MPDFDDMEEDCVFYVKTARSRYAPYEAIQFDNKRLWLWKDGGWHPTTLAAAERWFVAWSLITATEEIDCPQFGRQYMQWHSVLAEALEGVAL